MLNMEPSGSHNVGDGSPQRAPVAA
jgi:hypothetical protein